MNKTAIKNFAIWARNKLIADISYRAGLMGITVDGIQNALPQSTGTTEFYDIGTSEPYAITSDAVKQRRHLVELICAKERETNYKTAYKYILEEVAYSWFNRLIAVRFMEVNDYLPSHIRVLSSDSGKMEPDLVTTPFDAGLPFTRDEEQLVYQLKQENKIDELFRILFIKQCNALNKSLPALFEKTSDYTELLLNLSVIDQDGVVFHLVHDIPEEDFDVERGGQVEIIGWLYQYYNTEPKNEAFAKSGKISKEEIPAVTQLFTPDWIVRYMVENSVGRLWIEHLRALDESADEVALAASFGWKYYLPEAEQEPEVEAKLRELRKERAALIPEQITMIDPCMGSGHVLVYAFDVLMQIYQNAGYGQRDAAKSILKNNLFGLDIDDRAYQMAYFAVMMKAREYNRRILNGENNCKVYSIQESNGITDAALSDMGGDLLTDERSKAFDEIKALVAEFKDAKEYGSILKIKKHDWSLLRRFSVPKNEAGQLTLDINGVEAAAKRIHEIIDVSEVLSNQYCAICTNPPYMGSGKMPSKLSLYVKKYFLNGKTDMFAVFIEAMDRFSEKNGIYSMIVQPSFLTLSAFEKLRDRIIDNNIIISLLHMGRGIFGVDFGSTAFVIKKNSVRNYIGGYSRLHNKTFQYIEPSDIEQLYLLSKGNERVRYDFESYEQNSIAGSLQNHCGTRLFYFERQDDFSVIPGSPIAYWASAPIVDAFRLGRPLKEFGIPRTGIMTGDNNRFLRLWWEIDINNINFNATDADSAKESFQSWFPYNKGGDYRKWYGNNDYIVSWRDGGKELFINSKSEGRNSQDYPDQFKFKPAISWSQVSSQDPSFRLKKNCLSDISGACFYTRQQDIYTSLAFCNSLVATKLLNLLNPTIHFQAGDIGALPVTFDFNDTQLEEAAKQCVFLAKKDWDSYEVSWDFGKSPLCKMQGMTVEEAYALWEEECKYRHNRMVELETYINDVFIHKYHLENEISPEVTEDKITLSIADVEKDIKLLLSYAVGCMFGRYSLDDGGIAFAGGIWDESKYSSFVPDTDNVIPITDEEYLGDDIVSMLIIWLKTVFGEKNLETNLDFIARILNKKGDSSREIIRRYFIEDFYTDHCALYSATGKGGKRPVYWLFDSGKQNGFKALIYLHRYSADTIGNLRIDYLHRMQRIYESEISRMQDMIEHSTNAREVAQATKRREKLQKQLKECHEYDEKLAHLALSRIELDLDDGVKVNYRKIQTANDGKFYEVLADSKNIMAKEK